MRQILFVFWASLVIPGFALADQAVAPPRTVDDILAVLEQYRPDSAAIEKMRAAASADPRRDAGAQELAAFYHRRARAQSALGNIAGEIADLNKALSYASPNAISRQPEGIGQRNNILQELRSVEFRSGNYLRAIEVCRELIALDGLSGRSLWAWLNIEQASVQMGDMETAAQAAREIESLVVRLRQRHDWSTWENNSLIPLEQVRAELLAARGNYGEAERRFRAALEYSEKDYRDNELRLRLGQDTHSRSTALRTWAGSERNLGGDLLAQGRLAEAEYHNRNALIRSLQAFGRYNLPTADAIRSLAMVVFEQGRFKDAEKLSRAAVQTYQTTGVIQGSASLARARALFGATLVAQSRWQEAVAVFDERDRDLASSPEQYARLGARDNLDWAIALVRTEQAGSAVAMLDRIYDTQRRRGIAEDDYTTVQLRGFRALAMSAAGRKQAALAEYRATIPALLEHSRHGAASEQSGVARQQRLVWILEGYLQLIWELRDSPELRAGGIDPAAESFRVADVARGSVVQRALAASAARSAPADPVLADLARREQDALQRFTTLGDLVNRLLAAPPDQQVPGVIANLRKEISVLTADRAQLRRELARRFPEYAQLTEPKPASVEDIAAALAADEALISIYSAPTSAYIWAIRRDRPVAFAAVSVGDEEIAQAVVTLRQAVDTGDQPVASWPRFDVGLAHSLYSKLLKPVEPGWQSAATLLVVPHKMLGQLPFALLVTAPHELGAPGDLLFAEFRKVPWLIRRAGIVQLPTASTLVTLRRTSSTRAERRPFVGIGDPAFTLAEVKAPSGGAQPSRGPVRRNLSIAVKQSALRASRVANSSGLAQLAPLPDTADEVLEIARVLGTDRSGNVFLGADANERNVKAGILENRRIVVFATHGLVPGDLDGLTQPALALAAPQNPGSQSEDGLLTLDEILALKLNADWVVLSACNTASTDGSASEAVSGLGRGFFYAGARSLLVSNWPVETVSARLVTTGLFARQARDPALTRAEALRQTMLHMIDQEAAERFAYAHPLFWAPFSLVGDGGR